MDWLEILKWAGPFLVGAGSGLLPTIITQRGALRTKQAETEPALLREVNEQLRQCQINERRQGIEIHQLKGDLQTIWLALEMLLQKFPQAEKEIARAIKHMRARQKKFQEEADDRAASE